jgi:hypothetical protein
VSPGKVARFFMVLATQGAGQYTAATCQINGRLGILLYNLEGELETALSFQVIPDETDPTRGARIGNIYAIRNPDKLARLANANLH